MAKNFVHIPGYRVAVACDYPAVPESGDPVRYGYRTGIALTDEDSDGLASVEFGPCDVNISVTADGSGIAAKDILWFHDAEETINNTSEGGYFFGHANEAVTAGATATISVHHEPSPGAGTIAAGAVGTSALADGGVKPAKLSDVANSRPVIVPIGAVAATTSQVVFVAPTAGVLSAAKIVNKTAITADDTDFWTFTLVDKGAAGAGTDKIVEKTTEATGGSALEAYIALSLGTLSATHKVLAAGDVVLLTITKAASATALAETALVLEFLPTEA